MANDGNATEAEQAKKKANKAEKKAKKEAEKAKKKAEKEAKDAVKKAKKALGRQLTWTSVPGTVDGPTGIDGIEIPKGRRPASVVFTGSNYLVFWCPGKK